MTKGKVSISVPRDLLNRLERQRRLKRWSRSEAIQIAIEQWLRSIELDRDVADYIAGYLRVPEDVKEGQALLKSQLEGLSPEDWL